MTKLRNLAVVCALIFAIITTGAGEEQQNNEDVMLQPVSEEPIKLVHVLNPGEREYLSPNLIGLQNIAMTFLPLSINFINIIDAFREIVNGVRYEILLNAMDTKEDNAEIICRLVILEKPWLRTEWGDKVREMQFSNCTNPSDNDDSKDPLTFRNEINDKYSTSTIFNGGSRQELNADEMAKLESQIIAFTSTDFTGKNQDSQTTLNPKMDNEKEENVNDDDGSRTTSTPSLVSSDVQIDDANTLKPFTNPNINDESKGPKEEEKKKIEANDRNDGDIEDAGNGDGNENDGPTTISSRTSEKPNELTDEEKNLLDNIFSFGAFNFEQKQKAKENFLIQQQKQQQHQEQQHHEKENEKMKFENNQFSLIKKNEESNYVQPSTEFINQNYLQQQHQQKQQHEEYFLKQNQNQYQNQYQNKNNNREHEKYQLKEQVEQQQQLSLDEFFKKAAQDYQKDLQKQQQQQYQLPENENFRINDDGGNVHVEHSASFQDHLHRSKRGNGLVGGKSSIDVKEAEETLTKSLQKLAAGDGPNYKVSKVYSATRQIVSGTLTTIDADIIDSKEQVKRCKIDIWTRLWLPNAHEVTFKCGDEPAEKVRHSRSVEYQEKKTHKKHDHHKLGKVEHLFNKFLVKFKRHYHTTSEKQMRFRIFKQNLRIIEELNKNEMGSAKYGITEFADLTSNEYKLRTGLWSREENRPSKGLPAVIPDIELPKEFDWREKHAVTKVKNQGTCGSCWAFSVVGNIEGLNAIKTGNLQEFSEQELLDCDTVDSACNGGLPDNAYKALEDIGGLEYETEYPYKAHKNQCHFNKTMVHAKVVDYVDLPKNETAIAQWLVKNGPISVGINANAMQFYRGGVSHPWKILCSPKNLDHGVLIVGYGVSEYPSLKKSLPYWIIKNSWGPKWGEQGYYRVYRGANTCGIGEMASSAVLAN